ncbi:MAG: VOC family protein [Phenylobacterium sp.]|uniref:VOC family protein n=1 Tax=Phenylobacterium sp. TaxID=1871053 RepID=UPI00391A9433
MIGYVTIGSNDLEKAKAFYDAVLAPLGAARGFDLGRMQLYNAGGGPALAVCTPYDEQDAQPGNGTMVALQAPSHEVIGEVHAAALANGGTCEGPPGPRGVPGFYGAYFRDLDGNKLCVFKMG